MFLVETADPIKMYMKIVDKYTHGSQGCDTHIKLFPLDLGHAVLEASANSQAVHSGKLGENVDHCLDVLCVGCVVGRSYICILPSMCVNSTGFPTCVLLERFPSNCKYN